MQEKGDKNCQKKDSNSGKKLVKEGTGKQWTAEEATYNRLQLQ